MKDSTKQPSEIIWEKGELQDHGGGEEGGPLFKIMKNFEIMFLMRDGEEDNNITITFGEPVFRYLFISNGIAVKIPLHLIIFYDYCPCKHYIMSYVLSLMRPSLSKSFIFYRNDFNMQVLKVFVNLHEFSDMILVQALR